MGPALEKNQPAFQHAGGAGPMPAMPAQVGDASSSGSNVKECYRLCLNPKMNPGCSVAVGSSSASSSTSSGSSFVETESQPQAGGDWALDQNSDCLANCVRVCV